MHFNIGTSVDLLSAAARSHLAVLALRCSSLVAAAGLVMASIYAEHGIAALRMATRSSVARSFMARASEVGSAAQGVSADYVSRLSAASVDDQQILFATKLANEQSVRVQRIQFEVLRTESKRLGQHRLTMQLRGDYRDIKNIWIALLTKFPGLTLEHLAIRHRAVGAAVVLPPGSALSPGDRGDDEATIEMIQYLAPAKGEL